MIPYDGFSKAEVHQQIESRLNRSIAFSTFNRWLSNLGLSGSHDSPKLFYTDQDVERIFHFGTHLQKFRNIDKAIIYAQHQIDTAKED